MSKKDKPNKVTAKLRVVVTGEFYGDDVTEETLRYFVEQDLEDDGFEVEVELLKEQEPQLVLNIGEQISCKSGSCPKCGKMLNTTCNKRYCGDCGRKVKWE